MADDTEKRVLFRAHEIEYVQLDTIRPHPDNPNEGDVGAIAEAVDEVGFVDPIIVQRSTGLILAGEHRWLTLQSLGEPVGPVIFVDLDDEQALRYMIAANEIPRQRSKPRLQRLAELLVDLQQQAGGVRGTGFDADDVDSLLNRLAREREAALGALGTGGGSSTAPAEPPKREIPTGVAFRFGDYGGWVSDNVYESFRLLYEQHRERSGEVLLDDVLAAWLDL